jgi:uncharacterized protein YodC (DUF2158 family)
MDFKIGEVVQLKSGGPLMTVDNINPHDMINCIWFDLREKKSDVFPAAALKPVDNSPKSAAPRKSWAQARRI